MTCVLAATRYGEGAYFAVRSDYSVRGPYCPADSQGHRYIYRTRVLTGRYALGKEGMKEPPVLLNRTVAKYDSVVDDVKSPNMFVVFHDAQCYPEYMITFR